MLPLEGLEEAASCVFQLLGAVTAFPPTPPASASWITRPLRVCASDLPLFLLQGHSHWM